MSRTRSNSAGGAHVRRHIYEVLRDQLLAELRGERGDDRLTAESATATAATRRLRVLEGSRVALDRRELEATLATLGPPISTWDGRLARSLFNHDARFRVGRSGGVGLAVGARNVLAP